MRTAAVLLVVLSGAAAWAVRPRPGPPPLPAPRPAPVPVAAEAGPDFASFQARVAAAVASTPNLPQLRALRASFLYLRARDYMQGPMPGPQAHELRQWVQGHDRGLGGLMLAQEVASGWTMSSPSAPEDFPPGTSPETVATMRAREQRLWVEEVLSGLSYSGHLLAPEALWHVLRSADSDAQLRELAMRGIADSQQPAAIDLLKPCTQSPALKELRARCAEALGHLQTVAAVEHLLVLSKSSPDAALRHAAVDGLAAALASPRDQPAPDQRQARALATAALIPRALDPALGDDEPAVMNALTMVLMEVLQRELGPELQKPHPKAVLERINTAIANGATQPRASTHPKF